MVAVTSLATAEAASSWLFSWWCWGLCECVMCTHVQVCIVFLFILSIIKVFHPGTNG